MIEIIISNQMDSCENITGNIFRAVLTDKTKLGKIPTCQEESPYKTILHLKSDNDSKESRMLALNKIINECNNLYSGVDIVEFKFHGNFFE